MRYLSIFIGVWTLILLSVSSGYCQTDRTEGTVRYAITSDWVKMFNSLDYISQAQKDRATLMGGGRRGWSQYRNLHFSTTRSRYENSEEEVQEQQHRRQWRQDDFIVHNDFEANELTMILTLLERDYAVRDSVQKPVWRIRNDLKQIAGHMCMNATYHDSIRGYVVMAWFALDIPVSTGPDRFIGLPGLVLEVDINDGAMLITADRIEFKEPDNNQLDPPSLRRRREMDHSAYTEMLVKNIEEQKKAERPWFIAVPY